MKVMAELPEFFKPYLKPSSVVALPIQYDAYPASFDESYLDFIDQYNEYAEDRENDFVYELQRICDTKYASASKKNTNVPPERMHIEALADRAADSALQQGSVLILSLDASSNVKGFAVLRELNKEDTFVFLICANVKGETEKILTKIEELARKEKHKHITADAINKSLVDYYARYGFVGKEPSEYYRDNYIYNFYVEKQLGGKKSRLTKRRKVLSRRRRLHK